MPTIYNHGTKISLEFLKDYHSREPIDLSYNYRPANFIIYRNKNILLSKPGLITENEENAFMAAILF